MIPFVLVLAFLAVALFVWGGIRLFSQGWESYEERYVQGASRTLEAIWLTIPPQHLLYLSVWGGILLGALAAILSGSIYLAAPAALAGFAGPRIALFLMKRRRDRLFQLQFVHALAAISNSLRAGWSLPQAIEGIARQMGNPIRQEFGLAAHEMQVGVPLEEALANLAKRMPFADVELVVTAVSTAKEAGGSLNQVLASLASSIRERARIEGKIRAYSAMGRLQGAVMAVLPFAVGGYLWAFQPTYFAPMVEHPAGWLLLGGSVAWMALGGYFVYRILAIDL